MYGLRCTIIIWKMQHPCMHWKSTMLSIASRIPAAADFADVDFAADAAAANQQASAPRYLLATSPLLPRSAAAAAACAAAVVPAAAYFAVHACGAADCFDVRPHPSHPQMGPYPHPPHLQIVAEAQTSQLQKPPHPPPLVRQNSAAGRRQFQKADPEMPKRRMRPGECVCTLVVCTLVLDR